MQTNIIVMGWTLIYCAMLQVYWERGNTNIHTLCCLSKKIDLFSMAHIYIFIYQSAYCNLHSISQLDNLTWPSHFILLQNFPPWNVGKMCNKHKWNKCYYKVNLLMCKIKRQHPKLHTLHTYYYFCHVFRFMEIKIIGFP